MLLSIFGLGGGGVSWTDLEGKPDWATQAEAEAGVVQEKFMDPLRTAQAIVALAGGGGGGEANTASNLGTGLGWYESKVGVQLRFKSLLATGLAAASSAAAELTLDVPLASQAEAEAGTENAKAMSPLRTAQYVAPIKTKTDFISVSQAVDLDAIESSAAASKVVTDLITITQAVNLDTIETDSQASKAKTDWITVTQAVDLDAMETQAAAGAAAKVKTDFLTVTQAVDLDTLESQFAGVKTKVDFLTVTGAVDLDALNTDAFRISTDTSDDITEGTTQKFLTADEETKLGHISVTQAVDLDSMETGATAGAAAKVKTDFLTVTQAVDLDTLESQFAAAKVKTDFITISEAVDLDLLNDLVLLLGGGTTGQYLKKDSNTDLDFSWGTITGGGDFVKATDDTDDITEGATNKFATADEKTKIAFLTVTQAVDLDTLESDFAAVKTKVDFVSITQAVNLDTVESDLAGVKTKVDFLTVTQAVDLDSIESTLATALQQGRETIYIPAGAMVKRTSNGPADYSLETTTNKVMVTGLAFDSTADEFAQFDIEMPKSWNKGTITAAFHWHAPSGTGTVVWALQAVAISDDDVLDVAFGTAQVISDALTATTDNMRTAETPAITVAGTPAANDRVVFQVYRDPDNGSDSFSADAILLGVAIFFSTNANTDA